MNRQGLEAVVLILLAHGATLRWDPVPSRS
jgi:hypothetical protein